MINHIPRWRCEESVEAGLKGRDFARGQKDVVF